MEGGSAEALVAGWVVDERFDRVGPGGGIGVGVDDEAGLVVLDDEGEPAGVRDDARACKVGGFDGGAAVRFGLGALSGVLCGVGEGGC